MGNNCGGGVSFDTMYSYFKVLDKRIKVLEEDVATCNHGTLSNLSAEVVPQEYEYKVEYIQPAHTTTIEQVINKLAKDGWEFVESRLDTATITYGHPACFCTLQRRIND